MGVLFDRRAQQIGVTFHDRKTLDSFLTLSNRGPLTDMLFTITRPVARKKKVRLSEQLAAATPKTTNASYVMPKGMVQYRRELWAPPSD